MFTFVSHLQIKQEFPVIYNRLNKIIDLYIKYRWSELASNIYHILCHSGTVEHILISEVYSLLRELYTNKYKDTYLYVGTVDGYMNISFIIYKTPIPTIIKSEIISI